MVVRWWYSMMYAESPAEVYKLLWHNVYACVWHYLAGKTILWTDNLTCLHYIICTETLHSFYHWKLAEIIYNAKTVLVINGKDISSNRFSWSPWYFIWYCFVLGLCCLEIKTYTAIFHCLFYVCVHVDPIDGFTYQQPCLLNAMLFICIWLSNFSCSHAGFVILLPFLWYCQLSQFHLWTTNMAVGLSVLWLSLMTNHVIHILIAYLGVHHLEALT